jgi:hypothetical protein
MLEVLVTGCPNGVHTTALFHRHPFFSPHLKDRLPQLPQQEKRKTEIPEYPELHCEVPVIE